MTISHHLTFKSALLAATMLASPLIILAPFSAAAQLSVGLSVQLAPPILPIYVQPPIAAEGDIWTPGYWHWSQVAGYYWVPGTWVQPPSVGVLWTPPYWGWADGAFLFHAGYWGPQVGYYGGVNYGFGYGGSGYQGGRWDGGHFMYNRTVNNFGSVQVTNVYRENVTVSTTARVSYVGGKGGLKSEPNEREHAAEHDQHAPETGQQTKHISAAASSPALAASHNRGRPAVAATTHPAIFKGPGVVHAQPAAVAHTAARPAHAAPANAAVEHPAAVHAAARPVEAAAARAPAEEKGKEDKQEH